MTGSGAPSSGARGARLADEGIGRRRGDVEPHDVKLDDVGPDDVSVELQRVVQRWQQLPLDHARRAVPQVRRLLCDLDPAGIGPADLGEHVLMDQLTVLVYDRCVAEGAVVARAVAPELAEALRELRHSLG